MCCCKISPFEDDTLVLLLPDDDDAGCSTLLGGCFSTDSADNVYGENTGRVKYRYAYIYSGSCPRFITGAVLMTFYQYRTDFALSTFNRERFYCVEHLTTPNEFSHFLPYFLNFNPGKYSIIILRVFGRIS